VKRVMLLCALAACGGGSGDDDATPDADTRPPTRYGGDRPVELQPPTITEGETYPLIMVLHGYGATGLVQTAFLRLADSPEKGFFLLAPDGTTDEQGKQFWNASDACCGHPSDVDDVAYLGGVIDAVKADWPVDPSRVYIVGHSNGDFMAYRLACERADVITAIAGIAGGAYTVDGSNCDPANPVSVLHIHGTADEVIPYDGGTVNAPFPGAIATVSQWAGKDGCADTRTAHDAIDIDSSVGGNETTPETADGCPTGVDVELWTIAGGSHVPGVYATFGDTLRTWLLAHTR
jgi:polyhydroxybutyrate depolymerase